MTKELEWNVYCENVNSGEIEIYNIFNHYGFNRDLQKLKQGFDFKEEVRKLLSYYFCGRFEYEITIASYPAYINKSEFDRLSIEDVKHRAYVRLDTEKKVDIYDQVMLNFDAFIEYIIRSIKNG